ncbi:acetyl-CoA synthetase-like protein [Gonapodya prolifera JEL478]|uniref:Acetyl-CoA synthetase-like protein n=1 Tax=Gonapodya prolifera (strain JEL478) TaxID=1344416 RepID=A0A139AFH2_GONPJ|nr:acetyl-CoA synthetase-like protein [Gonapodya prolifera JEL478]|eukprot:KXS15537.1 acetyl-CoA synthetase-like protein [Gonapodya prolifera JEL478]
MEQKNLVIRDRIKEMIKVNGISVAPEDIESVLLDHPYVADAAVISIPRPSTGDCSKAFVLMHADKVAPLYKEYAGDEEKVHGVVRDTLRRGLRREWPGAFAAELREVACYVVDRVLVLHRHKQPDGGIEFVKEIPKNASGKLLRLLKGM